MRFLLIITALAGSCIAQNPPQRKQYQQDQYQDNEPQNSPQNQPQYESRPRHESTTFIPIIRFDKEQGDDGSYKTTWETGNNILAQEEGFLKSLGPDPNAPHEQLNAQVQQGSYTYTSPEGQIITVTYTADETGFHAVGDHLPTPPPVSAEVQKGLDLIYAGIKAQQEADDRELRENPKKDNQIAPDYSQYRQ